MKRLIALSIVVLTAFACKKEEVQPNTPTPTVPVSQNYPALHAGDGMWTVDRVIMKTSYAADTMMNFGTIHFVNDTIMILNQNGFQPNEAAYRVNAAKTILTIINGSMTTDAAMTWTNANKMNFKYDTTEGSVLVNASFELTRQ